MASQSYYAVYVGSLLGGEAVWYVRPMIRREVSKELVYVHGMSQAEVARRFGVTDAAISQYLKKKRGGNPQIEDDPLFDVFSSEIKESALRIAEDSADFSVEMCRLCGVVKRIGLLDRIYQIQTGAPAPRCVCTPVDEL